MEVHWRRSPTTRERKLDDLWKILLLHQFHDIIPGSGIHWVYDDTARDHARILGGCGHLADDALARHARSIDTEGRRHPVVIFNSLSDSRRELVSLDTPGALADDVTVAIGPSGERGPVQRSADGRALFEVTVPACGYAVYDFAAEEPVAAGEVTGDGRSLENEHLRIELDDQGLLSSVFDKSAQRQVLAPGRGQPVPSPPRLPQFRCLGHRPVRLRPGLDIDEVESLQLVERGPLRAVIRVTRRFGSSSPHPADPACRRCAGRRFRYRGAVGGEESPPQGGLSRRRAQRPGNL